MRKYNRATIERRVTTAVKRLLREDMVLLGRNVNERSVSHKQAEYLREAFRGWHVDCEYNRDKLRAFVGRPDNYQHGVFLKLSTSGEYDLEWFPQCGAELLSSH